MCQYKLNLGDDLISQESAIFWDAKRPKDHWHDTHSLKYSNLRLSKGHVTQGRRKVDNWGGRYSYIHVLHNLFPLKAIVFTVCEHEYMNICPPQLSTFRRP